MKNIETPSNAASDEAPLEKPDEAPGLETVSESEVSALKKSEEECSQKGAQHSAENTAGERRIRPKRRSILLTNRIGGAAIAAGSPGNAACRRRRSSLAAGPSHAL